MKDNEVKPEPFSFDMPMFDLKKARRPSAFLTMPEDFLLLIGHVVGAWSQFEISFDDLLKALITKSNEDKELLKKDFKKRTAQFKKIYAEHFAENDAVISISEEIVQDARRLYKDRNLITHGHIKIKVETFEVVDNKIPGKLSLNCEGVVSGKPVTGEYSVEDLENIRYEFAYLCGRVKALRTGEGLSHMKLTKLDIEAMQLFWKSV